MGYLAVTGRVGLATVFVLAVAGKLIGPGAFTEFTRSVTRLTGWSGAPARAVARLTVAGEAATVVLALLPPRWCGLAGCLLGLLLTAGFTTAVGASLRRGEAAPCRCFGRSATPLGARHVLRNVVLMLIAVAGLVGQWPDPSVSPAIVLIGTAAGLFIGLAGAAFDDIVGLGAPAT
jgi:hypothetical protein